MSDVRERWGNVEMSGLRLSAGKTADNEWVLHMRHQIRIRHTSIQILTWPYLPVYSYLFLLLLFDGMHSTHFCSFRMIIFYLTSWHLYLLFTHPVPFFSLTSSSLPHIHPPITSLSWIVPTWTVWFNFFISCPDKLSLICLPSPGQFRICTQPACSP